MTDNNTPHQPADPNPTPQTPQTPDPAASDPNAAAQHGHQQPGYVQQPGYQQPGLQEHGQQQPGSVQQPGYHDPNQPQQGQPHPGYTQPGYDQQGQPQPGYSQHGQPQASYDPQAYQQPGYDQHGQQQAGHYDPNQAQPGYDPNQGYAQPGQPQPGNVQPGYDQHGQPQAGHYDPNQAHQGYAQPGQPQPGNVQPGYVQPGQPHPGYEHQTYQQPTYDQHGQPHPGHYDPNQAQPGYDQHGQPQAGHYDPNQAQPGYAQPGQPHPGYEHQTYQQPTYDQHSQPHPGHYDPNQAQPGYDPQAYPQAGYPQHVEYDDELTDDDDEWQRPSWRQLLISLPSLLTLLVVTVIAKTTFDSLLPVLVAFFAFGIGAIGDVVRVLTSRYRLTNTLIEEKSQFLTTSHASTLVSRIRTVSIDQKWIQRLLSIADVKVTSGSDTENVTIKGITLDQANQLKHTLDTHPARSERTKQVTGPTGPAPTPGQHTPNLQQADGHTPSPISRTLGKAFGMAAPAVNSQTTVPYQPTAPYQPTVLTKLHPSWTWRSSLTGPGIFPLLAIFGLLQFVPGLSLGQIIDTVAEFVATNEAAWRDDAESWSIFGLGTLTSWIVAGVIAALGFSVVTYVANAVAYLVKHYGYKLTRLNPTTLEMVQGLFTRKTTSIDLERMRGLSLVSGPIERLAKTARLESVLTEGTMERLTADNNITPRIPRDEAVKVADQLTDPTGLLDLPLTPHGPRAARRRFIGAARATLIWAALIWAVTVYAPVSGVIWWALLPLGIWSFISAWLHYRALGYALPPGYVALRAGFWNQEHKAVQRRVALGIKIQQSFWQRPAGVTTLTLMDTADGHHLPDLTPEASHHIAHTIHPELIAEFLLNPTSTTPQPQTTHPATPGNVTTPGIVAAPGNVAAAPPQPDVTPDDTPPTQPPNTF